MKSRCYSPSTSAHGKYRDRGIKVCQEWENDFNRFMADMGKKPSAKHSLDRIDNTKGYSPNNCRWATAGDQASNRSEFNKSFEYDGKTMVLKDWARELGIKYTTLYQRIYRSGLQFNAAISSDPFDRLVEINNETKTVTEWCMQLGRKTQTVVNRIHDGWDRKSAILTPTPTTTWRKPLKPRSNEC